MVILVDQPDPITGYANKGESQPFEAEKNISTLGVSVYYSACNRNMRFEQKTHSNFPPVIEHTPV
jgi:hypothetical protein